MDLQLMPQLSELGDRTQSFIKENIIPVEHDSRQTPHGPTEELRDELVALAREAGLLTPHASEKFGGLGLTHIEKSRGV